MGKTDACGGSAVGRVVCEKYKCRETRWDLLKPPFQSEQESSEAKHGVREKYVLMKLEVKIDVCIRKV